ncbi:DUF3515 family protein [Streptomyces sp. SID8366]|uniref:DUF3515 family protein n=1 Tax=unclassified Streptomyces TaxID=2593676 RepID=UPI000DC514FA|nr:MULTISPECIES: DUF3515 family protein [unclassified Streptomyces]MYU06735.1 DUF3515 family protein [Streptomyces sp. SID8366]MYU64494.1 DUF3515 family protein [Streptomyces sp. SID69]RAJ54088.1 uncharacterized protein DUF3515 [Streptomyces sp. PsTaAH-130]
MKSMKLLRRFALGAAAGIVVLAVAGGVTAHLLDEPARGLTAAAHAGDVHCRELTGKAPSRLAGKERRSVGLDGVVVWGDQDVILRCGVASPAATTDPCFEANGIDWVLDERQSTPDRKVIVTFGRTPATQVAIRAQGVRTDEAILELSPLMEGIRRSGRCLEAAPS